jgi:hypothetical protein
MTNLILQASSPSSSLHFSNKNGEYFDLEITTPALSARKKIFIYTYASSNGFVDFFERLASFQRPWPHHEEWETLEGELKLDATCSASGLVEIKVNLQNMVENDNWSLKCTMIFDFGSLAKISSDAKRFMEA